MRAKPEWTLSAHQTPTLEYFVPAQSFSEVENTKGILQALADQFLYEVSDSRAQNMTRSPTTGQNGAVREARLGDTIQALEHAIQEFKGTAQEWLVVQHLLLALKKAGLDDRWLEVYLDALYRHPTHELIGRFATDAVKISRSAQREAEVINAFRHLNTIPFEFDVRRQVEAAALHAGIENPLAQDAPQANRE